MATSGTKQTKVVYIADGDEVDIRDAQNAEDDPRDSGKSSYRESREAGRSVGRYTRQSTKAKHHWKTVRKHVEQKSQKRASILDKWMDLKRSVSHEMGDFFISGGLNEDDNDWSARAERMRQRSFLLRTKKKERSDGGQAQPNQALLAALSAAENIYGMDDEADVVASDWLCKTPAGRLSTHSRQVSRVSSGSCKRLSRLHPSVKLEKDSVFKMAVNGIRNLSKVSVYMGGIPQRESSIGRHRSIKCSPADRVSMIAYEDVDETFFNDSGKETTSSARPAQPAPPPPAYDVSDYATFSSMDSIDLAQPSKPTFPIRTKDEDIMRPRAQPQLPSQSQRLPNKYLMEVVQNGDRRQIGIGMVGSLLGVDYRESRMEIVHKEIMKLQDYRPFFTYWVTFVQIVIYVFTLSVFDIAHWTEREVTKEVRMSNMGKGIAHYTDIGNMWLGPNQDDLIHLGAKYSPCMRLDKNVVDNLEKDRKKEKGSGCCVFNDGSGCAQMAEDKCSKTFASWRNMTVCGQHQSYCKISIPAPEQWSKDDITEWPICKESLVVPPEAPRHMTCEVTARPCCVGIHGQCIVTTKDYCDFKKGYFHPEAALCSQVKTCLSELCGMLPFYTPDQFYRLWTSLLLHAGGVQLLITVVLQFLVLRDLEKLLGWLRVGCIYIISGIGGSLASAIFLPYQAEAGPSGSQFAIIACLFVELIQNWRVIDRPYVALIKLTLVVLVLLMAGLMPWVDNYAHVFGFIFGFLLAFALMPYVKFNILKKKGRIISVCVCLTLVVAIFATLIILFYVFPIYSCPLCHYFNCIPITGTFCKNTEVGIDNIEL